MSSISNSKLHTLWNHFINAEPHSNEKSSWFDIFLAELLVQIKEGRDAKDALSFCSVGGGSVSTLVACELLSDVHELCTGKNDDGELLDLKKYLLEDRGWRCLAVLHLLGISGLSCARELVALLIALYPVVFQGITKVVTLNNPYIKFHETEDIVDIVDVTPRAKRCLNLIKTLDSNVSIKKKIRRHSIGAGKIPRKQKSNKFVSIIRALDNNDQVTSESELLTDGMDQAKSLTLKIRLNPMDFEYFTSIVRSDEEPAEKYHPTDHDELPSIKTFQDYIDERIKQVLDSKVDGYEASLMIVQLLQNLQDHDVPTEQTPSVQSLKFALNTLWSLEFDLDETSPLSLMENLTLKVAASKLMLLALGQVLKDDKPTTSVVNNGSMLMALKLMERVSIKSFEEPPLPEEGHLLQEFVFSIIYGFITFLYCLSQQRYNDTDKLSDFLELFQLLVESENGKLIERTVLIVVGMPTFDSTKSLLRGQKIIDMIAALTSNLKYVRRDMSHNSQCHRSRHKSCTDKPETHHHSDVFGFAYGEAVTKQQNQMCCVSSLFMILTSLLKGSYTFANDLQVRLIKVIASIGTCCCFPGEILLANITSFMKQGIPQTYSISVGILEEILFKELGAHSTSDTCDTCENSIIYSWTYLKMYSDLLKTDNPKLSYIVMIHLLKVTPNSKFSVREQLFFQVFYPTFLNAKQVYKSDRENAVAKFLLQSCLSVMSSLIINIRIYEELVKLNGFEEILDLLTDSVFTRSVYNFIEIMTVMEIWSTTFEDVEDSKEEKPAVKFLFKCLEEEIYQLSKILENSRNVSLENPTSELNLQLLKNLIEDFGLNESRGYRFTRWSCNIHSNKYKTDFTLESEEDSLEEQKDFIVNKKLSLQQASSAWRAAASVALYSPKFRDKLSSHPISEYAMQVCRLLAQRIVTNDVRDYNKSARRLFEALIICCFTFSSSNRNVVDELREALIDTRLELGRGLEIIVDTLLKVSMLRPNKEETAPQQSRPTLPTIALDNLPDYGGEDSSTGDYMTADDGYEADIENPYKSLSNNNSMEKNDCLGPVIEPRGHANANPALCSLTVDLLIHFNEQALLDEQKISIITNGLRQVAITCRESTSSCAALAGSGAITRILNGFKNILTSKNIKLEELQHAVLEVFTLLTTQSISPGELATYLSLFKVKSPPLLPLLEPLFRLVSVARPQPNFIISFPVCCDTEVSIKTQPEEHKNLEKVDKLVNHFKKKHLASGVCSPWSVHAICLPVGPELSWPVWLNGCSASMWLRVERGSIRFGEQETTPNKSNLLDSDNGSLSDWGVLSDNWSREVGASTSSTPIPTMIVHMMSIGFESLVLEIWLDLKSDKLILRLTRPDEKTNRTISETYINAMLSASRWHHLALNFKDTVLNKRSAVVEVTLWIDGWREVNAQLPFDGLLIRKPGATCILLGQIGTSDMGAWYLGNLMVFRCPVFNKERALYLASLGPNYTNLAECVLSTVKPDFGTLIASGALNGVREIRFEGGKFDINRRKSYGGTYLRHAIETKISETQIDWDSLMCATNSHLGELQDNLLLTYESQIPHTARLYPQAIANPAAVVRNLFPGQPGFRIVSAPEHRVSQQPPLSVATILSTKIHSQQYRGLIPAATLMGGMPIFLYLFARVVELNSTEEEQSLALSIVLYLVRADSELMNQYQSEGGIALLLRVLESPRCHAGKQILKTMLDAACDSPILIKDIANGNHFISQNCEAVIIDPELIKGILTAWRIWAKCDTLNLLFQALLLLLRDQHSQREFNAAQLNRVGIVEAILRLCKEHFMYEDLGISLDSSTGTAVVELIRALMGAPPEFAHLVAITDYLVLVHQASETYVTHSRHNIYFLLPPLTDIKLNTRMTTTLNSSSSEESIGTLENAKLNKALTNVQIQRYKTSKKREKRNATSKDSSAGEDSGIAASDESNPLSNGRQSICMDDRRACQGLVCEGLLLLLRDSVRVLPDCQISSVLKHVLRAEMLLVLANNPDARVRTALIKVVQTYLQRGNDEEVNKFIKQKYFIHLANQISLYPGSEPLVVTLENLVLRGPTLSATPPLLAMIAKAAATDANVAKPIVSFVTDIIAKSPNALKMMLEQGLIESLARALAGAAHKDNSASVHHDIQVLLVSIATKLLESPGNHQMQAVLDIHSILNHMELRERTQCIKSNICVPVIRDAQIALFDGELDALGIKVSSNSSFRLRSAASYFASAPYVTSVLTTSSEQSDHGSRSSSYGSLHGISNTISREPGKGEIHDRFRTILTRAVEYVTTADEPPTSTELQLTRRLFSILLYDLSSPLERKHSWTNVWSSRPASRKCAAKLMVWLLGPHQSNNIRVYAIRSLMEEPRAREILSSLLEVHPQVEQKFTVFLWDLLQRRDEMPSADARICVEFREALGIWDMAKGIEKAIPGIWNEELVLLRRELTRDRDIWIETNLPAIQRISHRFDALTKLITENAMSITRTVVEEQNRERKVLIEQLKQSRSMEAQLIARWRDLVRRLTHEKAPWHFPETYPKNWELDPTEGPGRVRIRLQRCHLNINKRFFMSDHENQIAQDLESPLSYLFATDRQNANASSFIERLHTSEKIRKMSQAKIVTPRTEMAGEVLIGETCLYFVPDNPDVPLHTDISLGGLDLAMVGGTAWRLEDIRELHRRRYQLQERAIEIFLVTGRTYLLAFNSSKERDEFSLELSICNLPRRVPGDDLGEVIGLWRSGALTNWEYITCLNKLAGRSYNDLMQYPVFPFVLADYTSEHIDLYNQKIYRNFKRPMAVQDKKNESHYINNYNYLKQALTEGLNLISLNQEPFHYGSHYSNSGTVLHFLVRLPPFTSMFLNYQDNNFDIPDRTFHALATTWRLTSCDSTTDVKELIPEFFYLPEFLLNSEGFNFGIRQNGHRVGDVELTKWCREDARLFILAHRAALEADRVREVLPYWIDLVFGFRQTGKPAVEAINVFHPATYYGFNVDQIADPLERQAWETMVKTYGQTPAQLFKSAHPLPLQSLGNTISQSSLPPVIEGISGENQLDLKKHTHGIKWGNYVGAPGNEPVLCWKHKHRNLLASLVTLITGDVCGLPRYTTLLLGYSKEKGASMLSGMAIMGAALASWNTNDGIARLKSKKEQPPKPLVKSSGIDPFTVMGSAHDCGQLWAGHLSGRITVYPYNIGTSGKIDFTPSQSSVLLGHGKRINVISLSRAFSIAVTGDNEGVIIIWDLNSLTYIKSIVCDQEYSIRHLSISETLGDFAVTYDTSKNSNQINAQSDLRVYTINARVVGSVLSRQKITALCYSNAPEGVSVNVIATGLDNGVIRLWSSWDLRLVREIVNSNKGCGAIISIAWSMDQHHFYAATEDCTVLIWEGSKRLSNGTPKFVNLISL